RIPIIYEGQRMQGRYADIAPSIASCKPRCLNQACSGYFYLSRSLGPVPVFTPAHIVHCFIDVFKEISGNYRVLKERTCAVEAFVSIKDQQAFFLSYVEHGSPH